MPTTADNGRRKNKQLCILGFILELPLEFSLELRLGVEPRASSLRA